MMTIVTGVNMNKIKMKISMKETEVKAKVEVEIAVGILRRIYLVAHCNDMIINYFISVDGDQKAGKNFLTNSFLFTLPM